MITIPVNPKKTFYLEDVVNSLDRREFVLFYQPLFKVSTGEFIGFEVLARLNTLGHIYTPNFFLDKITSIPHLNKRFTQEIFEKAIDFLDENPCYLHINIDATQLKNKKIINLVKSALSSGKKICLEIVETHHIDELVSTAQELAEIQALGGKIALDDFGMGYSNLQYLSHLSVDIIKIDKEFLHNIQKENQLKLLTNIIKLAQEMGIQVIVEGVETKEHLEFCKSLNVFGMQGFLLGRPMGTDKAISLLSSVK